MLLHEVANLNLLLRVSASYVNKNNYRFYNLKRRRDRFFRSVGKIFGYTAKEAIGRQMQILIPADRLNEEVDILARIARGERVSHFETIRRHKNGRLIHISHGESTN